MSAFSFVQNFQLLLRYFLNPINPIVVVADSTSTGLGFGIGGAVKLLRLSSHFPSVPAYHTHILVHDLSLDLNVQ